MGTYKCKYYLLASDQASYLLTDYGISKIDLPSDAEVIWSKEDATWIEAQSAMDSYHGRVPLSVVSEEVERLKEEGAKPSEIARKLYAKYRRSDWLGDLIADSFDYKRDSVPPVQLLGCLVIGQLITDEDFDAIILGALRINEL